MSKQFKLIILVNALLILLFVLSEYQIGNELNSYPNDLRYIRWSPFDIQDSHAYAFVNGNLVGIGAHVLMLNFPFWLFFTAIAINMYFIYRLQKSKDTKQTPS
jgi:hypothetical protein